MVEPETVEASSIRHGMNLFNNCLKPTLLRADIEAVVTVGYIGCRLGYIWFICFTNHSGLSMLLRMLTACIAGYITLLIINFSRVLWGHMSNLAQNMHHGASAPRDKRGGLEFETYECWPYLEHYWNITA